MDVNVGTSEIGTIEERIMERMAYTALLNWKKDPYRKPLVLEGARQVGKTWLLKEFGRREYEELCYVNCDNNPQITDLFRDYDIDRIIRNLSAITNVRILPGKTLIVLDEIQELPKGLTALKYFEEEAPQYHIAVAGSLLGMEIHEGTGFPVGKVDEISLYPMNFTEFLKALGKDILVQNMERTAPDKWSELSGMREVFTELLRQYYYVGGMPEVVRSYIERQDLQAVRKIQSSILGAYRRDFSKHAPVSEVPKINMVWDSIPSQLARENKKFTYSAVKKGGRAKEFENAILWLMDAGLIYKVDRVKKLSKPLTFYKDQSAFKLFLSDLGLLGAMSEVSAADVLVRDQAFTEYKGAFTEQYVAQQLISEGLTPCYYAKENSTLELDFVIQKEKVYPIEVKASTNVKSKSLRTVVMEHSGMTGWRFSMSDYKDQGWLVNVPLYLVNQWIREA